MTEQRKGWLKDLLGVFSGKGQGFELDDEDLDVYGTIAVVQETVRPDSSDGRIELRGSSWKATSMEQTIEAGEKAKVLYRDNVVWVVERYEGIAEVGEKDQ